MMSSWAEIVKVQVGLTMRDQATEDEGLLPLPLSCPRSPVFTTELYPAVLNDFCLEFAVDDQRVREISFLCGGGSQLTTF